MQSILDNANISLMSYKVKLCSMQCLLELTPIFFPAESHNVGTIMMKALQMKFLILKANSRYTKLNFWPQLFNPLCIPELDLVHFLDLEFRLSVYFRNGSAFLNQVLQGNLTQSVCFHLPLLGF